MTAITTLVLIVPKIDDFKRVNELAKQVHELHVNWNPDLFLSVDEVLQKDYFEVLMQNKEIFMDDLIHLNRNGYERFDSCIAVAIANDLKNF